MAMPRKSGLRFALSDPKRREICKAIHEAGRSSPRQLADDLGEPLSNLTYHVRVLRENGAVKLVDEQETRGSIKHIYELSINEPWALSVLGLAPNGSRE